MLKEGNDPILGGGAGGPYSSWEGELFSLFSSYAHLFHASQQQLPQLLASTGDPGEVVNNMSILTISIIFDKFLYSLINMYQ